MHETRQAARRRRRRRVLMTGTTAALATAGLLVFLVMALQPDPKADARPVTPAAGSQETLPPTPPEQEQPTTSPSAASPTPTAGATTPEPSATKPTARASATGTPRETSAAVSLAGRIQPGSTYRGVATVYQAGDGDGACLYGSSDDMMIAAMNTTDYETSKACGAHVLVRAANGASVTVLITNECPLPCAPGQLDLSEQAFAKLAAPSTGRIAVTWSLVSPGTSDTISIRYKTGSSSHWCALQAIGHRNPLARLEVSAGSGWRQLTRTEYNYFLSADGSGCGGPIRITDIHGERLVVDGIALRPDAAQQTGLQFARR
ncbi:expansin EXLX1 family cellulose-binding protein [Streptomyces sp. 549]|uniref:expansin EXLX1 family cellulose-binding protein n=1 Tax=Streptomyces sp. 549 TaxID=3049076 RepID=UPI0024C3041E|nr:expansin EXLX1 family cellulose-binding protein [Streptomyces sp. 549]MDK1473917.1 expansin EXLX1 family cellulose-binding protein [Streptomyces sp. 549]